MVVLYPKEIPSKKTCLGEETAGMSVRQFIWTKEKPPFLRVQQWHNFAFQFTFRVADLHDPTHLQTLSVMCPTRPDLAK